MERVFQNKYKLKNSNPMNMKKLLLFLIFLFTVIECKAQIKDCAKTDLLKLINVKYLDLFQFDTIVNNVKYKYYCPYYEFSEDKTPCGQIRLFALSKTYPEKWIERAKKGKCSLGHTLYGSLQCTIEEMFDKDILYLKEEFDLFIILTLKEDLEGPFREKVEGGIVESYYPKKGSMVIIYELKDDNWVKVTTIKNNKGESLKLIGYDYIKKIALYRMKEYFKR